MKKFLAYLSLCFAFSLLAAIMVAIACYGVRFRPSETAVLGVFLGVDESALTHYAVDDLWIASLHSGAEVSSSDCGVGFKRLVICTQTDSPKHTASLHFLTTLGWPQPIVSTGSEWLGRYDVNEFPNRTLQEIPIDPAPAIDGPATKLLWSGIIFDMITFGLPLLAVALWTSRLANRSAVALRRSITVTAVAWWIALVIPALGILDFYYCKNGSMSPKGFLPEISATSLGLCQVVGKMPAHIPWRNISIRAKTPAEFSQRTGSDPIQLPAGERNFNSYNGEEICGFAMCERTQDYLKPLPNFPSNPTEVTEVVRRGESVLAGWPMRAFSKGDATHHIFCVNDLSHLDVQWLLWFINVAVLSSGLAIICYSVVEIIRRWRRVAHGQCTTCRYLLNGSAICPECGRANAGSAKN